jgi:hypothetical protein
MRLFMVAWCRRVWDFLPARVREFTDVTDRYVEGELTGEELIELGVLGMNPRTPPWESLLSFGSWLGNASLSDAEIHSQAHLVRDIFGNPFRPVTVDPSWVQWKDGTVVQLARSIYDDRRFTDLPILADGLEDSGCTDRDILGHCRSGGDHVRGCWPVDLVLGKG